MKQYNINFFNLDDIIFWGQIKRTYPKLYKFYMNNDRNLDAIAIDYGVECSIYVDKNNYSYALNYTDIPESWDGELETGIYTSITYNDKQIMLKQVIKTIFGLIFLKTNYYGKKGELSK